MSSSQSLASSGGSGGGGQVLIETQTASASSSIAFTDLSSTYFVYKIVYSGVTPTAATSLILTTSSNNGSSYDVGASDYEHDSNVISPTTAASIQLTGTASTTGGADGEIFIINPSGTSYTHIEFFTNYFDNTSGRSQSYFGAGVRLSAADVDAVRFQYLATTIASGTFKLYGITA